MGGWQLFLKWHILMMAAGKWGMTKTAGWRGCGRWTWAVGSVEVSVQHECLTCEHTTCTALSALKGLTHAVKQQHNYQHECVCVIWEGERQWWTKFHRFCCLFNTIGDPFWYVCESNQTKCLKGELYFILQVFWNTVADFFFPPEWAVQPLINCLKWCHLSQYQLGLKTTSSGGKVR